MFVSRLSSARVAAALASLLAVASVPAFAASHTWSGSTSGVWSVGTNWSAGGAPVDAEANVVLVFPAGQMNMGSMTNDLTGLNVTSITFSDTAYSLTMNAINLNGTIAVDGGVSGGMATIGVDVALTGDSTFQMAGTPGSYGLLFQGVISGAGNLTLQNVPAGGTPVVAFSGVNTYTGTTTVTSGELEVRNAAALGATSAGTVVASGGTLRLAGVAVVGEPLTIGGSGQSGNGALQSVGALPNSWQGPITVTAPITSVAAIAGAQPLTLAGNIVDSPAGGSFNFRAGQNITLTGTNTYTGTDRVEYGTVIYDGSSFAPIDLGIADSFAGSTLAGSGSVDAVTVGGPSALANVIDPGAPGGGTAVLSVYTLNLVDANATLRVQLNGTTVGSQYDQVSAGFFATIGTGAVLDVTVGYAAAVGDTFTILQSGDGPVTGTFAGLPDGTYFLASGQPFQITYPGSSVVLTRTAALPVELQTFDVD